MQLHSLIKTVRRAKKRLGRGLGSGKGKTAGRGSKGQKARENVALGFIGGTLPVYKKLPFRRGLGNPKRSAKMIPVSVSQLSVLPKNSVVNIDALIAAGIVPAKKSLRYGVKIVNGGELKTPLTVQLPTTSSAAKAIEKAGGKVMNA